MPRIQPQDGPAKRPVMSWSSGKELVGADRVWRGLFLDCGLDPELDQAAQAAGWAQGQMGHLDGQARTHWLVPAPTPLYVLIAGVPYRSVGALARADVARSGIGCRWSGRSKLGVQVLHPDLMRREYTEPLALSVSSTSSDDLLAALLAHNAVLDRCEAAAAQAGRPRAFEFWQVACPFQPGPRVARGQGDKTTMISPIACAHPTEPTLEYLRGLLAPRVVDDIVAARWAEIERWAAEVARPALEEVAG